MSKKKHTLDIVIVNYNSSFWLKKTLQSLDAQYLQSTKLVVTVWVVDNGSTDDSRTMLAEEFSWTNSLLLEDNYGFAYANNRAIEQSSGKFVMLLNSDMELTELSNIDQLVHQLAADTTTAAITPKVVFQNGNLDPACHRGEPTLWNSFCYFAGLSRLFPQNPLFSEYHQTYKDMTTAHTISACSGAALLTKRSVIETIGLLDEQFFMYAEDLDWCKRMRDAGFTIMYQPSVSIIHHKYKSGIKSSSQKIAKKTRKHFWETMLQYFDKHYAQKYPRFVRTVLRYVVALKKEST